MMKTAPDIPSEKYPTGYPSKGAQIGPAWSDLWNRLSTTEWTDGVVVATAVALRHGISDRTVRNLLISAQLAGMLQKETRPVDAGAGKGLRSRNFYRINSTWKPPA